MLIARCNIQNLRSKKIIYNNFPNVGISNADSSTISVGIFLARNLTLTKNLNQKKTPTDCVPRKIVPLLHYSLKKQKNKKKKKNRKGIRQRQPSASPLNQTTHVSQTHTCPQVSDSPKLTNPQTPPKIPPITAS